MGEDARAGEREGEGGMLRIASMKIEDFVSLLTSKDDDIVRLNETITALQKEVESERAKRTKAWRDAHVDRRIGVYRSRAQKAEKELEEKNETFAQATAMRELLDTCKATFQRQFALCEAYMDQGKQWLRIDPQAVAAEMYATAAQAFQDIAKWEDESK